MPWVTRTRIVPDIVTVILHCTFKSNNSLCRLQYYNDTIMRVMGCILQSCVVPHWLSGTTKNRARSTGEHRALAQSVLLPGNRRIELCQCELYK